MKVGIMDERERARVVTEVTVPATIRGLETKVDVLDLSILGCKVQTTGVPVELNDRLILRLLDHLVATGHIKWYVGSIAGVEFDEPLDSAVVELLGFKPILVEVERMIPKDRFGRPLPSLTAADAITGVLLGERYT